MMFSIIIATWNAEGTLARCLDSLRRQQGAEWEILIADGGSTDRTMALVDAHRDLVAWRTSGPDNGVYDAWNKAIPHARGEWLMFLGADDWFGTPDRLARLAQAITRIPAAAQPMSFVYGETALVAAGATIEWMGRAALPQARLGPDDHVGFSHTGLLHHRSLFAELGLFDAGFRSAGDYEFLLRGALDPRVRFHHVPMVVAQMASGGMSSGAASRHRHYREMTKARRLHGLRRDPAWLRRARLRANVLAWLHRHGGQRLALRAANLYRRLRGKVPRGDI